MQHLRKEQGWDEGKDGESSMVPRCEARAGRMQI